MLFSRSYPKNTALFEALYLLLLPPLLLIIYRLTPFNNPDGNIDSWLYFSYIYNFDDLIQRYGLLYYAVRFGHIFPHIIFSKIFGPVTGYIAFVYSMYLLAGIPLYLVFRKYYSIHAAILAYSLLVSSVWFARTVLWTYTDATAVPYLIAATALLFFDSRYKRSVNFLIGALIALAINSNAFAFAMAGISGISYLILFYDRLIAKIKNDVPWIIFGMLFIFAIGCISYIQCCGTIDYFSPTISVINWSNNGGGLQWKIPVEKLPGIGYLYFPPFLIFVLAVQLFKDKLSRSRISIASLCYLLVTAIFFVWYEFAKDAVILETYFYFSYLLVPSVFCLALVPIQLAKKVTDEKSFLILTAIVSILLPALISSEISRIEGVPIALLLTVCFFTIILFGNTQSRMFIATISAVLFISVYQLFWITKIGNEKYVHADIYDKSDAGMSRFRLGLKFVDLMPKYSEEKKPIYFWYRNDDVIAKSLQSTYLWAYSRIMAYESDVPGLPELKGINEDLLYQQSSLVLFDRNKNIVQKGISALSNNGIKIKNEKNHEICEQDLCYFISILDVEGKINSAEKLWKQNKLSPVNYDLIWNVNQIDNYPDKPLEINTSTVPWDYAAVGILSFKEQGFVKPGVMRLLLSVKQSEAGIAIFGNDEQNFIKRIQVYPSKEPFELFLEFTNIFELKKIIFQNWNKPESANIILLDLDIKTL